MSPTPHQSAGPAVALARGARMPLVGFGTWQLRGDEAYRAVADALEVGYRHLDTATMYENEREVGRALADSGLARDAVFVTTKLPPNEAGNERKVIEVSLDLLGLDHVDLWLIHWPPDGARPDVWEQLLALRDEGLATDVGVSNYSVAQIDELVAATGEAPAVNQIPWAPPLHDPQTLAASRERGVAVEGYSPFRRTDLSDATLAEIAAAHDVTPAQVVLRWHVQHEVVVIPKSATPARIAGNFDVFGFELDDDEMRRLDALSGS